MCVRDCRHIGMYACMYLCKHSSLNTRKVTKHLHALDYIRSADSGSPKRYMYKSPSYAGYFGLVFHIIRVKPVSPDSFYK